MSYKWYVLQVYSGFEEKVAELIRTDLEKEGMENEVTEIFVPKESHKQVKNGNVSIVERKIHQGYIYIRMKFSEKLYDLIKKINKVSGFLGGVKASGLGVSEPLSVMQKEIDEIKKLLDVGVEEKPVSFEYSVGEKVQVLEGPFQSFTGIIQEIDDIKSRLKVVISIFNRETFIDLSSEQIKKV